ncbi:ComEC/Rec2 family competence protein [Marinitoga sp. 1197]|uniref:ComEC/Rec2 family competence protein n=2 Tax=Marinitoga TaxID=160798 RepID=UPI001E28553E|nr:ComEC/Rec2 family competence protein [Marinitoga sp. 1197]
MITTAIIFMAVVFFLFNYSLKTKVFFILILSLVLIKTITSYSIPTNKELGILGTIIDKSNNYYIVKTNEVYYDDSWKSIKGKLYFSYNKFTTDPFEIGNNIYIVGKKTNGKFDPIYMANSSEKSIYSVRNFFKKRIYRNFQYDNREILFSVVFGGLKGKNAEIFKNTGLLHLFAVSGFHVYIIYSLLYFLYSFTLFPINIRRLITIIILFIYLSASGFSDSAMRATFLLSIIELNKLIGWNVNSKNILGLIGVINLLYNPNVLFSAGFLMSYFAALSILIIIEYTNNPFLVTLSAFLAVLPWSILFFKGFSFVGIFLSVFFTPIIYSLMILSGLYIIVHLPDFVSNFVNYYISIIKSLLQYINRYIPYITLKDNSYIFLYFISIILLIFFHIVIYKRYTMSKK